MSGKKQNVTQNLKRWVKMLGLGLQVKTFK